jgi:Ser/Thr protein kinase RdoA (MazF antagonist)
MDTSKSIVQLQENELLHQVLHHYTVEGNQLSILPFGSGLINRTWKVQGLSGNKNYILQKLNTSVFKNPTAIAENIASVGNYLAANAPGYFFVTPLPTHDGSLMVHHENGDWYRLMPFVENTITFDTVDTPEQAYEAAWAFGTFAAALKNFPANRLHTTLPDFHNLSFRFYQYRKALHHSNEAAKTLASKEIEEIAQYFSIQSKYEKISADINIPLRVMHHDTKISNCLFDEAGKHRCIIDLDTLMPGYFISDVGDMCRSYLSPQNEESTDCYNIGIRMPFYKALAQGYLAAMGPVLSKNELEVFTYAGKFLIYMQALRYLSDFLNGNVYYPVKHPLHNLDRTKNQLALLKAYCERETDMQNIISKLSRF